MDALAFSASHKELRMSIFRCSRSVSFWLALAVSALVAPQAMACYTVYNPSNKPVYSNMSPPIDMSYQIHERLPAVFPGGHMVFGDSTDCPLIDARVAVPELSNVAAITKRTTRRSRKESRN
jgi:hypothetical protein